MAYADMRAAIEALPGKDKTGGGRMARCPVHDDDKASLSVDYGDDGQLLLKCHAGCRTEDIVAAMGGTTADLFPPNGTVNVRVIRSRRTAGSGDRTFDCYTPDGTKVGVHRRVDDGHGDKRIWFEPRGIKVNDLALFGTHELTDADPVVVVEGERATLAVRAAGLQAVGTYGSSYKPSAAALEPLRGRDVVLWPDNDDPGRKHMAAMNEALGKGARVVAPPADAVKGWDAADADTDTIVALVAAATGPGMVGIDAADLMAKELPPLRWIVPGLLPEGTSLVAAHPKTGKSCLVYQIAVEVSLGGELFGERVESGSALYLALEDGERRGQERLRAALAGRTMPRGRLEVRWSASRIGQGLEEELSTWLDEHHDATFVAVDTLGRVRPSSSDKRNAYDVDVDHVGRLQNIFRDRSVAFVLVHHLKKGKTDDFVEQVSGTYGVAGSVDTIIHVNRKRNQAIGTISVTGRDVPDGTLPVSFDDMVWSLAPEALTEGRFERIEVYDAIKEHGPIFPKAIGDRIGKERTAVQHLVEQLVASGDVIRGSSGYVINGVVVTNAHSSHPSGTGDSSDVDGPPNTYTHPPHSTGSTHSNRERSEGGYIREPWDTPDPVATPPAATVRAGVDCRDYSAHQSHHRRLDGETFTCDICNPEEEA